MGIGIPNAVKQPLEYTFVMDVRKVASFIVFLVGVVQVIVLLRFQGITFGVVTYNLYKLIQSRYRKEILGHGCGFL